MNSGSVAKRFWSKSSPQVNLPPSQRLTGFDCSNSANGKDSTVGHRILAEDCRCETFGLAGFAQLQRDLLLVVCGAPKGEIVPPRKSRESSGQHERIESRSAPSRLSEQNTSNISALSGCLKQYSSAAI